MARSKDKSRSHHDVAHLHPVTYQVLTYYTLWFLRYRPDKLFPAAHPLITIGENNTPTALKGVKTNQLSFCIFMAIWIFFRDNLSPSLHSLATLASSASIWCCMRFTTSPLSLDLRRYRMMMVTMNTINTSTKTPTPIKIGLENRVGGPSYFKLPRATVQLPPIIT